MLKKQINYILKNKNKNNYFIKKIIMSKDAIAIL